MKSTSDKKPKSSLSSLQQVEGGIFKQQKLKLSKYCQNIPIQKSSKRRPLRFSKQAAWKGVCLPVELRPKRGNVKLLIFLQKNVLTADIVFGTFIFMRTLYTLLKEGIDQIIDTQPVGTAPIIKAIKIARKLQANRSS